MRSFDDLRRTADRASAASVPSAYREVARRALLAWIHAAERAGMPFADALRRLAAGEAAVQAGRAALEGQLAAPDGPAAHAACTEGCAFCCILTGNDGGTISRTEAEALHTVLAPLAGHPDGRHWTPRACPALDPETRLCRAYDARPSICRSYISPDVDACEAISRGEPASGPGVLGGHVLALSVLALTRETLKGTAVVPTYSMSRLAAAAVEGAPLTEALKAARHAPKELKDEIARHKTALSR